jgi:DNA modification methylase
VKIYHTDSYELMTTYPDTYFDSIICDPPYDQPLDITKLQRICKGNIITFCKPENQYYTADEYLFWIKTPSTKNFQRKCGRFVEMILVLRGENAPFNQLYWSQMTGVFDDRIVTKPIHPFEKPLTLMERLIRIYTNPGDVIFDPFMGSGTTLIAAHNLGRDAVGSELDVDYYNLAKNNLDMCGINYA